MQSERNLYNCNSSSLTISQSLSQLWMKPRALRFATLLYFGFLGSNPCLPPLSAVPFFSFAYALFFSFFAYFLHLRESFFLTHAHILSLQALALYVSINVRFCSLSCMRVFTFWWPVSCFFAGALFISCYCSLHLLSGLGLRCPVHLLRHSLLFSYPYALIFCLHFNLRTYYRLTFCCNLVLI